FCLDLSISRALKHTTKSSTNISHLSIAGSLTGNIHIHAVSFQGTWTQPTHFKVSTSKRTYDPRTGWSRSDLFPSHSASHTDVALRCSSKYASAIF
ncbi:hypothetical protein PAXRUDRAFT_199815, partial [Paxillus rubicundulus Ve08.2h10]